MDFEKSQTEGQKLPAGDHVEEVLLQEDGLIRTRQWTTWSGLSDL